VPRNNCIPVINIISKSELCHRIRLHLELKASCVFVHSGLYDVTLAPVLLLLFLASLAINTSSYGSEVVTNCVLFCRAPVLCDSFLFCSSSCKNTALSFLSFFLSFFLSLFLSFFFSVVN
jgi:hypothetical protein